MDRFLSVKIRVVSFCAILMVVVQHTECTADPVAAAAQAGTFAARCNLFVQHLFSLQLCKCAVPLFFTISGHLFFLGMKGTPSEFLAKYRKRFFSVLVPYLICSGLNLLFRCFLDWCPALGRFSSMDFDSGAGAGVLLGRLLFHPVEGHLWFLRDLVVLVLLSPVLYYALRFAAFLILPLLFYLCAWNLHPADCYFFTLGSCSLFYFSLGGFLAFQHDGVSLLGRFTGKRRPLFHWLAACRGAPLLLPCLAIWIGVSLFNAYCFACGEPEAHFLATRLANFAGMIVLWRGYDYLVRIEFPLPLFLFSDAFFIYLFHEPTLDVLQVLALKIGGASPGMLQITYWGGAVAVVVLMLLCAGLMDRYCPAIYRIVTGYRPRRRGESSQKNSHGN